MDFRTIVGITPPSWRIEPADRILCVGSCFAQRIGERMVENGLRATVNPWGTLYNPASITDCLKEHGSKGLNAIGTPDKFQGAKNNCTLIITLGTTHVFERDGRVVSNCQKLPAHLFTERDMEIGEIATCLQEAIEQIHETNPLLKVILTVSPYRYAHWGHNSTQTAARGMHGNQLSKARLLLAVEELTRRIPYSTYFPAYEIVLDELRDYRFYDTDMLHPSQQAVDYIWKRFTETMLSESAREYIREMEPIRRAYAHRPFNPDSDDYHRFIEATKHKEQEIIQKYIPS